METLDDEAIKPMDTQEEILDLSSEQPQNQNTLWQESRDI